MTRLLTILGIALVFEAIGVVFLSRGLKEIGELRQVSLSEIAQLVGRGLTNPHILLGVLFEAFFFVGLLMLISKADVSFIWPLTSLGFVVTTVAAKMYLDEHVSSLRWSGVCLIMIGAAIITWTEKHKTPAPTGPQVVQSPESETLSMR